VSGPVRPRHAASLILLRRERAGPTVLMGRRPAKSRFAPDVFVFPGGKLDRADFDQPVLSALAEDSVRRAAAPGRLASALATAAIRETAGRARRAVGRGKGHHTDQQPGAVPRPLLRRRR
jgi:8-oxo-dGTP pyrophosphatase MutT (NUDIX family)